MAAVLDALELLDEKKTTQNLGQLSSQPQDELQFEYSDASLPYKSIIEAAEARHELPKNLLPRVIHEESRFNPSAVGPVTKYGQAQGISQIMRSQHPTVKNPFDPYEAIPYSASYLRQLYDRFKDWNKAVAAYHAGPENIGAGNQGGYVDRVFAKGQTKPVNGVTDALDLIKDTQPKEATIITPPKLQVTGVLKPPGGYNELGQPLAANGIPISIVNPFTGERGDIATQPWPLQILSRMWNPIVPMTTPELYKGRVNKLITPTNPRGEALSTAIPKERMVADVPQDWWQWVRSWVQGTPKTTKEKATIIKTLQDQTGMTSREVIKNYDEMTNQVIERSDTNSMYKMGKNLVGAGMTGLIASQLGNPVSLAVGLGTFLGMEELISLGTTWAKEGAPRFGAGQGFADLLEAQGFSREAIGALEFIATGIAATKFGRNVTHPDTTTLDTAMRGVIGKALSKSKDKISAFNDLIRRANAKGEDPTVTAAKDLKEDLIKDDLATTGQKIQEAKGTTPENIVKAQAAVDEIRMRQIALEANQAQMTIAKEIVSKNVAAVRKEAKAAKDALELVNEPEPVDLTQATHEFTSKKGKKYSKVGENWYDESGNLVKKRFTIEAAEKSGKPIGVAEEPPAPAPESVPAQPVELTEENMINHLKSQGYSDTDALDMAKFDMQNLKDGMLTFTDEAGQPKPVTNMEEYAKQLKEFEAAEGKVPEREEPYTSVDEQTGEPIPESLQGADSPFRVLDKAVTEAMSKAFEEKMNAVRRSPEMTAQFLANEVNKHLNGVEGVDIKSVVDRLSELASRADELRRAFDTDEDFEMWKETVSEMAAWARRNQDKPKIGITPESGVKLNTMIPVDQIPKIVKDVIAKSGVSELLRKGIISGKTAFENLYRNIEIFYKTGFWLGRDWRWRYEIDDSKMKIEIPVRPSVPGIPGKPAFPGGWKISAGDLIRLDEIVKGGEKLFDAVPDMRDVLVKYDPNLVSKGSFNELSRIITLRSILDKESLWHEMQHAVDFLSDVKHPFLGSSAATEAIRSLVERTITSLEKMREVTKTNEVKQLIDDNIEMFRRSAALKDPNMAAMDFFMDNMLPELKRMEPDTWKEIYDLTTPSMSPFERYLLNQGEMNARLNEARMGMSAKDRAKIPPWETLDRMLEGEKAINIFRSGAVKYGKGYEQAGRKLYSGVPIDKMVVDTLKKLKTVWHGGPENLITKGIKALGEAERKGTGGAMEGAGFYVGEGPKVGEYYARGAKKGGIEITSETLTPDELRKASTALRNIEDLAGEIYSDKRKLDDIDIDHIIEDINSKIADRENFIRSIKQSSIYNETERAGELNWHTKRLEDLRQAKRLAINNSGDLKELHMTERYTYLHKLNLPIDEMNWLEWDKPVHKDVIESTQLITGIDINSSRTITPELRNALNNNDNLGFESNREAAGAILEHSDWQNRWEVDAESKKIIEGWRNNIPELTGKEFYQKLVDKLGSKEEASKWLSKHGIDGMKYPAADPTTGKRYSGPLSNYVIYDPAKWIKTENIERVGLYSGIPLDEINKQLIKMGRNFAEAVKKSYEYKSFHPKEMMKKAREEVTRAISERSGNIARELVNKYEDRGEKIKELMYLQHGAHPYATNLLRQMGKEVFGGLDHARKRIADSLTQALRLMDIAKYKTPKQYRFPIGKSPEESAVYAARFAEKDVNTYRDLTPEEAHDLYHVRSDGSVGGRVGAYFDWMRKVVNDAFEEGLISERERDDLVAHNYRRTELVQNIFDKKSELTLDGKRITVNDSGIETLAKGKETDIYEASSELMALETFNRIYGRIFRNRANKELLELARTQKDNPFARVKESRQDKIPEEFRTNRIRVYENGKPVNLYLSELAAKEWISSSPQTTAKYSTIMKWISMAPVVRTFATGVNWSFALRNLPRDMMHLWLTARTYENGKYKSVYSPTLPVSMVQIGRDIASVFSDVMLKKGDFNDYIEDGGGMDFLTSQGRVFKKGRHIEGDIDKIYNYLGYFGNSSEMLTRTAIRLRGLKNEAKRRGVSLEEIKQDKDARRKATFAARDYMDFHQGGNISKALDTYLPYLNARFVAGRGLARAMFKDQPVATMYKVAQLAALMTGLYIGNQARSPETMAQLDNDRRADGNLVFPLGDHFGFEDAEGQTRYPFLVLPIDQGMSFFKALFEGGTNLWLGKPFDIDRLVRNLGSTSPVDPMTLPPSISGGFGYLMNKNLWLNKDIMPEGSSFNYRLPKWLTGAEQGGSEEEYREGETPQAFVDLGKATGLSPERTKYLVEQLVTNDNFFGSIIGKGYDALFNQLPKEEREEFLAETLAKTPIIRSFFKLTNPYARYSKDIDKAEEDVAIDHFIQDRGLRLRAKGFLFNNNFSRADVMSYINEHKDVGTVDRLTNKFEFLEATKDLPNRSFWLRLKGLNTEARARAYVDRFDKAAPDELGQLRKEEAIVDIAGGILTKEFYNEVMRLRGLR